MLRFLEALNPWNSCFTVTDFDDALIDIHSILNTIDLDSKDNIDHSISMYEKKQMLENAFTLTVKCLKATSTQKPDKQLTFLAAEVLRQHASICYKENYFAAKQIFLAAFNLHLYSIGISNDCIDICDYSSLHDLTKQGKNHNTLFSSLEESILTTNIERCITLAHTTSFAQAASQNRLQCLAETARWLGHCYQHLDQTVALNPENDLRFAQLFGLSESLLLLVDKEESKRSLADLYYQAWPFMYLRKHPEDVSGACRLYEQALHYDSSKEMQARISNQRFLLLFSHGRHTEALPYLLKAIFLAETLNDHDDNRFLLASLYDNYANYLMTPETLDLEQAEIYLSRSSKYVAQLKASGKDHLDFTIYERHLAEFKVLQGEFKSAKDMIECTIEKLKNHSYCQQTHAFKAEALKAFINKALALQK